MQNKQTKTETDILLDELRAGVEGVSKVQAEDKHENGKAFEVSKEVGEVASVDVQHAEPEKTVSEIRAPVSAALPVQAALPKDRVTKDVESILSEDLTEAFLSMSQEQKAEFKAKGEETATKVRMLICAAKINAKKIFDVIKNWLKLVPGVNKFFLEQEAKIKTDKVLILAQEEKRRAENDLS